MHSVCNPTHPCLSREIKQCWWRELCVCTETRLLHSFRVVGLGLHVYFFVENTTPTERLNWENLAKVRICFVRDWTFSCGRDKFEPLRYVVSLWFLSNVRCAALVQRFFQHRSLKPQRHLGNASSAECRISLTSFSHSCFGSYCGIRTQLFTKTRKTRANCLFFALLYGCAFVTHLWKNVPSRTKFDALFAPWTQRLKITQLFLLFWWQKFRRIHESVKLWEQRSTSLHRL